MRVKQHPDGSLNQSSKHETLSAKAPNQNHCGGESDQALRAGISQALTEFIGIPRDCITISVLNGHVTLRGTVDSYYRKQLAQAAVMTVDGVASVQNGIRVIHRGA